MEQLLDSLKVNLGITSTGYDDRLLGMLNAANEFIAREGAVLNPDSFEDGELLIMYASWLWRRRDTMEAMPKMLRWTLNNRIFSRKMVVASD